MPLQVHLTNGPTDMCGLRTMSTASAVFHVMFHLERCRFQLFGLSTSLQHNPTIETTKVRLKLTQPLKLCDGAPTVSTTSVFDALLPATPTSQL